MRVIAGPERPLAPQRLGTDWIWGGLGLGCALASASFAFYMAAVGPPAHGPGGDPDFGIFARADGRSRDQVAPAETGGPPAAGEAPAQPGRAPGIDLTPTGSIADARSSLYGPDHAGAGREQPAWLRDYAVRDVFDGKALVEARSTLQLVEPGTVLEGVGRVTAIERQDGAWVVVTTGGTIGGAAP